MTAPQVPHLARRLSSWLALLSMLGLGSVSVVVFAVFSSTLAARQQETMNQKRDALVHVLSDASVEHRNKSIGHTMDDFLAGHNDFFIRITDTEGHVLFDRRLPNIDPRQTLTRTFEVQVMADTGALQPAMATLTMDRRADDALLRVLALTLMFSMVAGSVILSLVGRWLVRRGLSPIQSLVTQTAGLSARDLHERLDERGLPQELLPLVRQFNALLDRLAGAYRQMESFNADVAHELNTPLATLISSSEVALRKPRPVAEMQEVLESNLEDLRRMAGIVNDMLFLSRADKGQIAERAEVTSLREIAHDVAEFYEAVILDADLHLDIVGDVRAAVDVSLIRRALSNLLSNATRYAERGSTIIIAIEPSWDGSSREAGAVISVTNTGEEIEQRHLKKLFDRFYRADESRQQAHQNHGLGLAIVQAIARMHGGSVHAESRQGRTTIGMEFPSALH